MDYMIEELKEQDICEIKKLYISLYEELNNFSFPFKLDEEELEKWLDSQISSPLCKLLVVKTDNELAGFLSARITKLEKRFVSEENSLVGFVNDIYVSKEHRRHNLGTKLYTEMEHWFCDNNVHYVQLNILTKNIVSASFFENIGYEKTSWILHKKI